MTGRRVDATEKSMGSYGIHAWRDALSIADLIDAMFGYAVAKNAYSSFSRKEVLEFEIKYHEQIGDFIQKSESQREPYLRRIAKDVDDETRILFLTLALVGVLRAKALIELRDRFRTALAPGRGNRITIASLYDLSNKLPALYDYKWPVEAFEALDLADNEPDD
jgi:hypothetical protein